MTARKLLLLTVLFLLGTVPLQGASEASDNPNPGLQHSLEANRSLLKQYQSEYLVLKNDEAENSSDTLKRKMRDLEDKIRALEEDSQALQSFLPVNGRAQEFIEDMMIKKVSDEKIKQTETARMFLRQTDPSRAVPTAASVSEAVYRLHERALQYISKSKFKEALDLYQEIVLKNPNDDEAYIIMGHSYLLTGQYQKAESAFHNAVSIDPENIHEITPFYENMVLQNPNDDTAFAHLGYAWLILGDLEKARDAFQESLRINSENGSAQNGLMYIERLMRKV